jgi:outer membrane protein OmpA-like peptidoglycan-associated protein
MKKISAISLIFLFLTIHTCYLFAQTPNEDVTKLLKEAQLHFKSRSYMDAISVYERILEIEPHNTEATFYMGLSHLRSLHKDNALGFLLKLAKTKPDYHLLLDFYIGESYKYKNQMKDAIEYFEKVKAKFPNPSPKTLLKVYNDEVTEQNFVELINQRIREAKYGIHYLADPTNASVNNIGDKINSKYSDYAPVIAADESVLIFTSRRKGTTGKGTDVDDQLFYEDIYIAHKKNGEWEEAKNIGSTINSKFHEASIALSPNGKELFIYKDENSGDIYYSDLISENEWDKPKKVGGNINSTFHEPSVSITDDGKTLYFASDRPGGFGGLDIYKSVKNDKGDWEEPVNLGAKVNTAKDEDSPFIHFDSKTLYFSSQGHQSMGGFDIFYAELLEGEWTDPVNLGFPINTTDDDIHFVLSADYRTGYYASARPDSRGAKDIYFVEMPDYKDVEIIDFQLSIKTISVGFNPLITKSPGRALVILRGVVKDEQTDQLISAKMSLIDVEDNQVVEEIDAVSPKGIYYTTMLTGKKYLLHVQKEGYMYHSEYFEIPLGVVNQEKILHIYLKRINIQRSIDFKALFDYNSAKLKKQSIPALEKLYAFLEANPRLKGEIEGHTDDIGTDQRNQALSQQRAKSVYDYLVERGIDANRLKYAGYGESKSIATNTTPHGRSLNRRTEFRILEIN